MKFPKINVRHVFIQILLVTIILMYGSSFFQCKELILTTAGEFQPEDFPDIKPVQLCGWPHYMRPLRLGILYNEQDGFGSMIAQTLFANLFSFILTVAYAIPNIKFWLPIGFAIVLCSYLLYFGWLNRNKIPKIFLNRS